MPNSVRFVWLIKLKNRKIRHREENLSEKQEHGCDYHHRK